MSAVNQLDLFDGFDEANLYHPDDGSGFFSLLWKDGQSKRQWSYRVSEMAKVLNLVDYQRDTWISQAEFCAPNRRVVNLARVGLLFVDLDTYKADLMRGRSVEQQVQTLHFWCHDRGIPLPSFVVFSGRGLQAKWLLTSALPRAALPRWNACQKALVDALAPLGADNQARDASRVLRLVHSLHSISGEHVHVVDVQGDLAKPNTYCFEQLAEQLLPLSRSELLELREERASHKARRLTLVAGSPDRDARFRGLNGRALAWARLEDLRKLGEIRGGWVDAAGVSQRTRALHWQLNFMCLSGAAHPSNFHHEARELAKQIDVAWSFASDELSTLRAKAEAYARGQKIEFGGRTWPALYTPKNTTLIEMFGITDDEQRQLKTIISPRIATERNTQRETAKRRAAGVIERRDYVSKAQERKARIRELGSRMTAAQIAQELGVSLSTVKAALRG
ncbi:replication protein [Pseudomonas aeruginosa]